MASRDKQSELFVELMEHLSIVFLQDAPGLKQQHPVLSIWQHKLFQTNAWNDWESQMLTAMESIQPPAILAIQTAIPEVTGAIGAMQVEFVSDRISNSQAFSALGSGLSDLGSA
ncbi:hypothetical protein DFS34DRAFT_590909 [Phlyctochytrium arcticum]|nr:hypothetical protein DFS34DRAFT_590909 [Phlyctochytrium arcticum]